MRFRHSPVDWAKINLKKNDQEEQKQEERLAVRYKNLRVWHSSPAEGIVSDKLVVTAVGHRPEKKKVTLLFF